MKLSIKRCLFSFVMSTALAGTVRAQSESAEGVVRLGSDASSAAASAPQADPAMEGYATPYASPYGAASSQYGPPPNFGMTEVDRVFRMRGRVDVRGGHLYGYNEGYTNAGIFAPLALADENSLIFADVRALVTNQGKGGANVGVGLRHYEEGLDRVFGASVWYDYDNGHVESYNQIGISLESLGRFWDWRVNGYIPVGQDKHALAVNYNGSIFSGHNILLNQVTTWEQAYHGFDTEVGGPFPILGRYGLNGYVGFYYFTGANSSDFTGVSGRIQAQLNEDLSLGVTVTDDHTFGTNTQIQVVATLPDGTPNRWLRPLRVYDRMFQPVNRNYRAIVSTIYDTDQILAINPKDDLPYFVDHINPNALVSGDGSTENPFNSLANYTANETDKPNVDIVYVQPRLDGSSANLDTGITLLTGQRLLSTSIHHMLPTPQGSIELGGYTGGALPVLTNPTGDVVVFADGANCIEVSGFTITGSTGFNGISGTNNSFVMINNNTIQGADTGVLLTNLSGTFAAGMESTFNDNIFSGNDVDGLAVINDGAADLDVVVVDNVASNNGRDGIRLVADNGSVLSGLIDGNLATGNTEDGIHLASDSGVLNFNDPFDPLSPRQISNNTVQNNTGDGIGIDVSGTAVADLLLIDNTAIGNENGIHVTRSGSAELNVVLSGNTTGSNTGAGVAIDIGGAAVPSVTISTQDTIYENNVGDGLRISGTDNAVVNFFSTRDIFRSNGGNGLTVSSDLNSTVNAVITNATGQQNANGAAFLSNGNSTLNVTLQTDPLDPDFIGQTVFENNGQNGVLVESKLQSTLNLNVADSVFRNNAGDGLHIARYDQSDMSVVVLDSEFTLNTSDGLEFNFTDSNNVATTLFVDGSSFTENTGNGMNLFGQDNANLEATIQLSDFSNNTLNGVQVFTDDGSVFGNRLTNARSVFDGITATENGVDGLSFTAGDSIGTASTQLVAIVSNLDNTLIADNAGNGITANSAFAAGTISPAIGNDIPGSGEAFMDLAVMGDLTLDGTLNQTLITGNGLNGIGSTTNDTAIVRVGDGLFTGILGSENVLIENNAQDGIFMRVQTSADGTIQVQGIDDTHRPVIRANGGDGIELSITDPLNSADSNGALGTLVMDFAEIGGRTIDDQNGGHGLNLNANSSNNDFIAWSQMIVDVRNSNIRNNALDGVHIDLEGQMGLWGFTTTYNNFNFDNNLIADNGWTGIYMQQNAGQQMRLGADGVQYNHLLVRGNLPNPFPAPGAPFDPDDVMTLTNGAYGQTGDIANNGQPVGRSGYMLLMTSMNSIFTATNNTIQHNGLATTIDDTMGDGIFLRVSTNSYLGADIGGANGSGNGNTFSGNRLADLRTEAFSAYRSTDGVTMATLKPDSQDAAAPALDRIFLDDSAQLDLRFFNNVGNTVNPQTYALISTPLPRSDLRGDPTGYRGAFYLQAEGNPSPQTLLGFGRRDVDLFQVANFNNSLNTSNIFDTPINAALPGPQNLINDFLARGWWVRNSEAWPGPNFPVPYNTNPGNPFSP